MKESSELAPASLAATPATGTKFPTLVKIYLRSLILLCVEFQPKTLKLMLYSSLPKAVAVVNTISTYHSLHWQYLCHVMSNYSNVEFS
jgi:hypothetical protein